MDWWALGILTHELLYGVTPFRGQRRDETFENVLRVPLNLPQKPAVSPECRDFITQLLVRALPCGLWALLAWEIVRLRLLPRVTYAFIRWVCR